MERAFRMWGLIVVIALMAIGICAVDVLIARTSPLSDRTPAISSGDASKQIRCYESSAAYLSNVLGAGVHYTHYNVRIAYGKTGCYVEIVDNVEWGYEGYRQERHRIISVPSGQVVANFTTDHPIRVSDSVPKCLEYAATAVEIFDSTGIVDCSRIPDTIPEPENYWN